jgi:iron-sulfur cluster repair protein YtfE (RIC family)
MEVEATTTLSEIVQERLSMTGLFEEIGLDYYCGGNQSLKRPASRQTEMLKRFSAR